MAATLALALLAGLFSTVSPCVLPLLPIVLGAAGSTSRLGPAALAGGLVLSFVGIGLFFALAGQSIGLDQDVLRTLAAGLLLLLGLTLAIPALSDRAAAAASPAGGWIEMRFGGFDTDGTRGQFLLGLLLGAVWSPCVGPTLGAASVLAAQGRNIGHVVLTMLAFGAGAALPLLVLGLLSREAMNRWRNRLLNTGKGGKVLLGLFLAIVGIAILTGLDKQIEAALVAASPAWLTELTTRF